MVWMDMARKRRRYSDDERATLIAMLETEGYPNVSGALKKVSEYADVHTNVLRRWWKKTQNPPPTELVTQKKGEIKDRLQEVVHNIIDVLPDAIDEAGPRDLFTGLGIAIDKLQLLSGQPTLRLAHDDWRSEAIALIKEGRLEYEALANEFDTSLAEELFRAAGINHVAAPEETAE